MANSFNFNLGMSSPNEVLGPDGEPFPRYRHVLEEMARMGPGEWEKRTRRARG